MKKIHKKSGDQYIFLLSWCGLSPVELLMRRRVRTPLPQTDEQLIPKWSYLQKFWQQNRDFKDRQKTLNGITEHATCLIYQRTPKSRLAQMVSQYEEKLFSQQKVQCRMLMTLGHDRCLKIARSWLLRPIDWQTIRNWQPRLNRLVGSQRDAKPARQNDWLKGDVVQLSILRTILLWQLLL